MFSVGKDLVSAKIAGDLTETNAKVISSVEETSHINLYLKKIFLMLNIGRWSKLKLKKEKTFRGKYCCYNWATGTIGFETYKIFKSYGAEVVLLDMILIV